MTDERGQVIEGYGPLNVSAFAIHAQIHAARPDVVAAATPTRSTARRGRRWDGSSSRSHRTALSRELNFGRVKIGSLRSGSGRGGGSPRPECCVSEDAERAAGHEMALDVERVLEGGVNR